MSGKREYHIRLSNAERKQIKYESKRATVTRKTRCCILLEADENKKRNTSLEAIAKRTGTSINTVTRVLKMFVEGGLTQVLLISRSNKSDKANQKYDVAFEERVVSILYSDIPEGRSRWTLELLRETVALQEHTEISLATIGRITKKYNVRPHMREFWCIPPDCDAAFVACMEDIISIYHQPVNPRIPRVCLDEKPYQLLDEKRDPIPMTEANPEIYDYEYKKNGTVSIFCAVDVDNGCFYQQVHERRTAKDFAEVVDWLVNEIYKHAEKIILICDNLNTHNTASLYKAFKPDKAFLLMKKIEIHYTPIHGSWLDMAEIGIRVMTGQCLDRRIPDIDTLRRELKAWEERHNSNCIPVQWKFDIEGARVKLHRIYPSLEENDISKEEPIEGK